MIEGFEHAELVEGLGLFPFRYGSTVGTHRYTDMTVQSVTAGGLQRFTAPEGYRRIPEQRIDENDTAEPPPLELDEVFPGVFRVPEVRSGFAPLVVTFENFTAVVDAPASFPILGKIPAAETDPAPSFSWHSERLVEAVTEAFPERPLRYLILTHGHEDHAGGGRAFVAAGATVMAAPAVGSVVERLVALPPWQARDRPAEAEGRTLRFEAIEAPRVLDEGERRLEILPLGDNPMPKACSSSTCRRTMRSLSAT